MKFKNYFYKFTMKIAIGGTFDRLHKNHEKLLKAGIMKLLESNEKSVFEIYLLEQGEIMKTKKNYQLIESWNIRRDKIKEYLNKLLDKSELEIEIAFYRLSDKYGNSVVDDTLDAIICPFENKKDIIQINEYRKKRGLKSVRIFGIKRNKLVENSEKNRNTLI